MVVSKVKLAKEKGILPINESLPQRRKRKRDEAQRLSVLINALDVPLPKLVKSGTRTKAERRNVLISYSGLGTPETNSPDGGRNVAEFQRRNAEAKIKFDRAKKIAEQVLSGKIPSNPTLKAKALALLNREAEVTRNLGIAKLKSNRNKGATRIGSDISQAELRSGVSGEQFKREEKAKQIAKFEELKARKDAFAEATPEGAKVRRQTLTASSFIAKPDAQQILEFESGLKLKGSKKATDKTLKAIEEDNKRKRLESFTFIGVVPDEDFSVSKTRKTIDKILDVPVIKQVNTARIRADAIIGGVIEKGGLSESARKREAKLKSEIADEKRRLNSLGVEPSFLDKADLFGKKFELAETKFSGGVAETLETSPVTTLGSSALLGFGTTAVLGTSLKAITKVPKVTKFLGSSSGAVVRKGTDIGLKGLFVGTEATQIATADEPFKEAGKTAVELPAFFGGAKLGEKALSKVFFSPSAEISREEQLQKLSKKGTITKAEEKLIRDAIELQPFIRKVPDITPSTIEKLIPKQLTKSEKKVVVDFLVTEKPLLFGGKTLEARGLRKSGDLDTAIKGNREKLSEVIGRLERESPRPQTIRKSGEAIGIGDEKLFDIKAIERVKGFAFSQRPVQTAGKKPVPITRLSEQASRSLGGTLELRKGGKDIRDVLLTTQASLERGKALNVGGSKRALKKGEDLLGISSIEESFPSLAKRIDEVPSLTPKAEIKKASVSDIPKELLEAPQRKGLFASTRGEVGGGSRGVDIKKELKLEASRLPDTKRGAKFGKVSSSKVSSSILTPSGIVGSLIAGSKIVSGSKLPAPSKIPRSSKIPTPSRVPTPSQLLVPSRIPTPSEVPTPSRVPEPSQIRTPLPTPSRVRTPLVDVFSTKKTTIKKPKIGEAQGYNVFVKNIIRRDGKEIETGFVKANKSPLVKQDALGLGAVVTDKSIAQTFRIAKAKGKATKRLSPFEAGYFNQNRFKFRGKIRKGKQIDTRSYIEKRPYAIDSIQEINDLSAGRFIKRRNRQASNINKILGSSKGRLF